MKKILTLFFTNALLFASGTWFFGEAGVLRNVYGFSNNQIEDGLKSGNYYFRPVFRMPLYDPNYHIRNACPFNASKNTPWYGCSNDIFMIDNYFSINGIGVVHPGARKGSQGFIGFDINKNGRGIIKSNENFYFEISLLRDRSQSYRINSEGKDTFRTSSRNLNAPEFNPIFGDYARGIVSKYEPLSFESYNEGEIQYSKLDDIDRNGVKNYKLVPNYRRDTKIEAYVEYSNRNFLTNPAFKIIKQDYDVNFNDKNSFYYGYKALNNSKDAYDEKDYININAPEVSSYLNNKEGKSDNKYNIDRATAMYAVNTIKNCKERILYKVEIKRIQILGKNMDYSIFDSYHQDHDFCMRTLLDIDDSAQFHENSYWRKKEKPEAWVPENATFWGHYNNGRTCTGDTTWATGGKDTYGTWDYKFIYDYTHGESDNIIFYVLQDGSKEPNARSCLPEPKAKITSAFVNNINGINNNLNINFAEPRNTSNIYAYIDGEDVYLKLNFNDNANTIYDLNANNSKKYLSLDSKDAIVYLPSDKNCVDNCQYKKIDVNSLTNNEKLPDDEYFKYKDKFYFPYSNAIINFKNIKTIDNRKNFNLNLIFEKEKIPTDEGIKIKHDEIMVRAAKFNATQQPCDVLQNCNNKKLHISETLNIKNQKIRANLFITQYALNIAYQNNNYIFNLPYNDKTVNDNNAINISTKTDSSTEINNTKLIVPFDIANLGSVILKDENLRHYFENNKNNFTSTNLNNYCRVSQPLNTKEANTRINGKIACQTPLDKPIIFTTNSTANIQLKNSIDGKYSAIITSKKNGEGSSYKLYPSLNYISNNKDVAKYFDKDMILTLTFNTDSNKVNGKNFEVTCDNSREIKCSTIVNNNSNIQILLTKNNLNKPLENLLNISKNYLETNKTTLDLLTSKNKDYQKITLVDGNNNASIFNDLENKSINLAIAQPNPNAYEIPLSIKYKQHIPLFKLTSIVLSINNETPKAYKVGDYVRFVSATPLFKDAKIKGNQITLHADKVKLFYLDKNGSYRAFEYKTNNFVQKCFDDSVCLKIKSINEILPGFEKDTKLISEYKSIITKKDNTITIKLDNKYKSVQYVKDKISCIGGEYNCSSNFTVEFIH